MKKNWVKKGFVVSVILLFIGVSIAPSINFTVVKASNDNDLVEVTTQACGINGFGNTTVKLTKQQYQNLEQYLVDFRARLNQTTTREEAVLIFKEAVVELNRYGLLPKGMSVEKVQKLVLRMYSNAKNTELFKKILGKNQEIGFNDNFFCLVTGSTTNSFCFGAFFPLRLLLCYIAGEIGYVIFGDMGFYLPWVILLLPLYFRGVIFPLYLFGELTFGRYDSYWSDYYPCTGTILAIGILGLSTWSNSFYGQIRTIQTNSFMPPFYTYYTGILGFTGLCIQTSESTNSFIGSCLWISIAP